LHVAKRQSETGLWRHAILQRSTIQKLHSFKIIDMEVICLQDLAFYSLIETVVKRIKETENIQTDKWISSEEAMSKLRITSATTLQKLRDEGEIRFSHPMKKVILYDTI
jgi:hypothetical protein